MQYKIVEKTTKTDVQGNINCEVWLRDEKGGYSLFRVPEGALEPLQLGDEVDVAFVKITRGPLEVSNAS